MTTPTTWIPITTRRPTASDLPVLVHTSAGFTFVVNSMSDFAPVDTHWQPAQLPPPPPKDRTQREEDEEAFCLKFGETRNEQWWLEHLRIWHAVLAYRDAQNRVDLERMTGGTRSASESIAVDALRKRCGL